MKKKTSKRTGYTFITNTFLGQQVTTVLKNIKSNTGKGTIANLMFTGILLDECEDYLYLGNDDGDIHAAVKKTDIGTVLAGNYAEETLDIDIPEGAEIQ